MVSVPFLLLLWSCGQKTDLYLPEEQAGGDPDPAAEEVA
nr:lipoprotein [Halorhodospira abdelmalekii]